MPPCPIGIPLISGQTSLLFLTSEEDLSPQPGAYKFAAVSPPPITPGPVFLLFLHALPEPSGGLVDKLQCCAVGAVRETVTQPGRSGKAQGRKATAAAPENLQMWLNTLLFMAQGEGPRTQSQRWHRSPHGELRPVACLWLHSLLCTGWCGLGAWT